MPLLLTFCFILSGAAGLIYESIWSHYLKLFLGHAAYAQTLVLALFMGGMSIGAGLCSRLSLRWTNLLRGYALVTQGPWHPEDRSAIAHQAQERAVCVLTEHAEDFVEVHHGHVGSLHLALALGLA